jgi:integrin beta 1
VQVSLYQDLIDFVGFGAAGVLTSDASNMVDLLNREYQRISETVSIVATQDPLGFVRSIVTNCTQNGVPCSFQDKYEGVKPGQSVFFDVTLRADQCHAGTNEVVLTVVGFGQMRINVEMTCNCSCSDPPRTNSTCTGRGSIVCGLCVCDSGSFGPQCQCTSAEQVVAPCANGTQGLTCSNRGTCFCGDCVCSNNADGVACECSRALCPTNVDNVRCSGNGVCLCNGTCECLTGYMHPRQGAQDCSCDMSPALCPRNNKGQICNSRGTCECGACICLPGFSGEACTVCNPQSNADCPLETDELCNAQTTCLSCVSAVQTDESQLEEGESGAHVCAWCEGTQSCYAVEKSALLCASGAKNDSLTCPLASSTGPNTAAIAAGTVIGAIAVGIGLLVMWRVMTKAADKRAWQQWEDQQLKNKYVENANPLYASEVREYDNPVFFNPAKVEATES